MDPHSRAPKKNTSHENEVLPQDTTHLKQRPCYQRGSPCQDPAGNRTTQKNPDDHKETQTAVVWLCLPFIRSSQNHLTRHSERGKKTRQTDEEELQINEQLQRIRTSQLTLRVESLESSAMVSAQATAYGRSERMEDSG